MTAPSVGDVWRYKDTPHVAQVVRYTASGKFIRIWSQTSETHRWSRIIKLDGFLREWSPVLTGGGWPLPDYFR